MYAYPNREFTDTIESERKQLLREMISSMLIGTLAVTSIHVPHVPSSGVEHAQ